MALMTIQQLLSPPTSDQIRAAWVTSLVGLGIPADKWRKGGVFSTILTVLAMTYAAFAGLVVAFVSAGFLNSAKGGWLDLLAFYVYNVLRIQGAAASGNVLLTNSGGGIYVISTGGLTVQNAITKQNFVNTAPFTLGAGPSTLSVPVSCQAIGSIGSSNPGDINVMVTSLTGVTVSNPSALVGNDTQSDVDLRTACTNKLGTLSVRGVQNAYAYAVTSALNGGNPVNINRVSVSESNSNGRVTVTCASPSGPVSPGDLAAALANILLIARPQAVSVTIQSAVGVVYGPTVTVYVRNLPGINVTTLATQISTAFAAYVAIYPIGGFTKGAQSGLWGSGIAGVVKEAVDAYLNSLGTTNTSTFAVDGAVDLILASNQVATNSATFNVVLV